MANPYVPASGPGVRAAAGKHANTSSKWFSFINIGKPLKFLNAC
jgi:hypothetical protein